MALSPRPQSRRCWRAAPPRAGLPAGAIVRIAFPGPWMVQNFQISPADHQDKALTPRHWHGMACRRRRSQAAGGPRHIDKDARQLRRFQCESSLYFRSCVLENIPARFRMRLKTGGRISTTFCPINRASSTFQSCLNVGRWIGRYALCGAHDTTFWASEPRKGHHG